MDDIQEDIQKVFIESTKTVFDAIAGFAVIHLSSSLQNNYHSQKELFGILDLSGALNGSVIIGMSTKLTTKISQIVTDLTKKDLTDEIIHDTVGEIVNQVAGVAKAQCADMPCKFSLGLPRVYVGMENEIAQLMEATCQSILFDIGGEELELILVTSITENDTLGSTCGPKEDAGTDSSQPAIEEYLVIEEDMEEIVDGFVLESEECLDSLDHDLVELDTNKDESGLVGNVFRNLHTLKGNSRALGFETMEFMVHRTEDVIRKVQDGELQVSSKMMDVVFEAVDQIKLLLQDVKERKKRSRDLDTIVRKLKQVLEGPAEEALEEDLVIADDLQEIVDGFVIESEEYLEQLDQDLVSLDASHDDMDLVGKVFRNFHTLKGNSRALGFEDMETTVHGTEDVIRKVQDGEMKVSSEMLDVVLESVDLIKALLQDVKERKKRSRDLGGVLDKLAQVLSGDTGQDSEEKLEIEEDLKEIVDGFVVESEELLAQLDQDLVCLEDAPEDADLINKVFRALHTLKGNARSLGFESLEELDHQTEDVVRKVRDGNIKIRPELMDVVLRSVDVIKQLLADIKRGVVSKIDFSDIKNELKLVLDENYDELKQKRSKAQAAVPAKEEQKKTAATTIRVDINKLDKLIDVTGELVLHKNRLLNFTQRMEQGLQVDNVEEFLNEINAQMGFLVSDLQSGVMSTRMQPIGKVFSKYPRVVRDLSRESGKEIDLVITGQETELDNTIVEEIGDPLIHMVRNSCDHGVETPEVRTAQGKNPKGTVELMAYYEGNFVVIEIRDDGKGIDKDVIKRKGVEKGLITEEQAKIMAKGDIFNLIFMPGFSTAEKVTAVSGRGVGMDVVKTSIAKLNGIIEMDSEIGKGTTVKIKLPLTLAVMLGLEIEIGREKYLLPQETVIEIVTVSKEAFQTAKKEKKFLFRKKNMLPLLDLRETFMQGKAGNGSSEKGYIVVIGEVEKRTGLLVDNVIQQQEVVIKPLGKYVNNFMLKEINGATIMGDGSIELIINHNHLMAAAQEIGS